MEQIRLRRRHAAAARFAVAVVVAAVAGVGTPSLAQTKPPAAGAAPTSPPKYTNMRWDEDYSYLRKSPGDGDFFDPIKYIPLTESGETYVSLGGQARYRYEYFNNLNFGAGPEDNDGFHLYRFIGHVDFHLNPYVRTFIQGKTALVDDREGGPRGSDADEADIQQFFVDLGTPVGKDQSVNLRLGRQDLLYGAQRLIAPSDWGNARRTFEGAKFSHVAGPNAVDLFWVRPVVVEPEELNDGDGNTSFAGVYDTLALPQLFGKAAGSKLEVYGLALNKATGDATDSDTYTVGTRLSSTPKPWNFDVELDYQFGQQGEGDISAWSVATEAGYQFAGLPYTPRVYLGVDVASGDQDPNDPDRHTFNQLFALGHSYFGFADVVARQNSIDVHPGVDFTLLENRRHVKKLTLRADYHVFWRQSDEDALYDAGGKVLRPDSGSDERFVGSEVDLLLNWQYDRHLSFYFGYSHFFTGTLIEETGPSKDIDFLYAAACYTF